MVSPKNFGPKLWFILHSVSAQYPDFPSEGEKFEMYHLLIGLPAIVPCELCKGHTRAWMASHKNVISDVITSKRLLFQFILDFHNDVNGHLNKQKWTLDEAKKKYNY